MSSGFQGHRAVARTDGSNPQSWLQYKCGHCGTSVSGAVIAYWQGGVTYQGRSTNREVRWLLCPECVQGSVWNDGNVVPGAAFGPSIQGLPSDVDSAYKEAQSCMRANAFVAAELLCRKILMHVAVDKGAKEGDSFAAYLSHLESKGFITPPMKGWVELIRKHGNDSTHKLAPPVQTRAESTVMFTAELLRLVYEMEFMANRYTQPGDTTGAGGV